MATAHSLAARIDRLDATLKGAGREYPYLLWSAGNETEDESRMQFERERGIALTPLDRLIVVRWRAS